MSFNDSIERIKYEGTKYIPGTNLLDNMKTIMDLIYDTKLYNIPNTNSIVNTDYNENLPYKLDYLSFEHIDDIEIYSITDGGTKNRMI